MREGSGTGGGIHSARTVGGGAGSPATVTLQRTPHMFPER